MTATQFTIHSPPPPLICSPLRVLSLNRRRHTLNALPCYFFHVEIMSPVYCLCLYREQPQQTCWAVLVPRQGRLRGTRWMFQNVSVSNVENVQRNVSLECDPRNELFKKYKTSVLASSRALWKERLSETVHSRSWKSVRGLHFNFHLISRSRERSMLMYGHNKGV